MSKGCENHCNLLKQANDKIRKMAEWIYIQSYETPICDVMKCDADNCVDCIIKYFEGLEG